MSSDVAAICQQIERECLAMKAALSGAAVVATHAIITHRFHAISQHQQRLIDAVGEQEASRICYETYAHVIGPPDG